MSEQKPKIDLKARLGKKPMSSPMGSPPVVGGSSIPPPVGIPGQPSAPVPSAMPAPTYTASPRPVTASGVPAPPFTNRPAAPAPRVDPTNPYAPVAAVAAPARPQQIRIEVGSEEIQMAARGGRKKVAVLALITAIIGGFVGFTIGGGVERSKGADAAVEGAQQLAKDVQAANAEVQKLADTLKSAKEKLGKGQFPEQEVSALGAINIPFSGANLAGKGIGRFQPELISMLIEYTNHTTEANDQKEKVQNVLNGAKKGILELLSPAETVRWSVQVTDGPNGPWAQMSMVPAAFSVKEKWPDEIKLGPANKQTSFKRYTSGGPSGSYIPVDPSTQVAVCPSDVIFKLRREINDLETVLRGDQTPGAEKTGILESGTKLIDRLKKIGASS